MSEEKNNDELTEEELELLTMPDAPVLESPVIEEPATVESIVEEVMETAKISEVKEDTSNSIISSSSGNGSTEAQGITAVADGVIGTGSVARKPAKKPVKINPQAEAEKVAVFSTRNVTWSEVGKVYRGYNIVTKDAADKWLTRDHIRLATPEEIAREFGN